MGKSEKILNCPNCDEIEMRKITCGPELVVDQCPECLGIWFDDGELSNVKKLGDFYIKEIDKGMKKNTEEKKERICPRCKKKLAQAKPKGYDNLIIDICDKCKGIWLDRGELINLTRDTEKP